MLEDLAAVGVDALIVQDPAVISLASGLGMDIHASTQCAVRTVEKARFVESLGYRRIVLERQMSLSEVEAISSAVSAEIEFFVHGALCVCYSGQCYLSEYLTGRSANRGECAQACRSLYDVEDASGKVLARNKAILSLKDYNLIDRLGDLAAAGVCSFKIEGRLKGESYVRNVVRAYSIALDAIVASSGGQYSRASYGHVRGGFVPDLDKTFNRGYTSLFIDGVRGSWAAAGGGEYVGIVSRMLPDGFVLEPSSPSIRLSNGDGFTFASGDILSGFRADVCDGFRVRCKRVEGLAPGVKLYRNYSTAFERSIEASRPSREIDVSLTVSLTDTSITVVALSEDGRTATASLPGLDPARDSSRALSSIREQLSKRTGIYSFTVSSLSGTAPFLPASSINALRRSLTESLDAMPLQTTVNVPCGDTLSSFPPCQPSFPASSSQSFSALFRETLSYKANIANPLTRSLYASLGVTSMEDAYELTHRPHVELMRSRYCVRHQLGLCPKQSRLSGPANARLSSPANARLSSPVSNANLSGSGSNARLSGPANARLSGPVSNANLSGSGSNARLSGPVSNAHLSSPGSNASSSAPGTADLKPSPLYLINNGRRLRLCFHCSSCEMTVEDTGCFC